MNQLLSILSQVPEFPQLLAAIDSGGCPAAVTGLAAVHRAHITAALGLRTGRPVVAVCADEGEADRLARDLAAFSGETVPVLTPRSFTFRSWSRWRIPPPCCVLK